MSIEFTDLSPSDDGDWMVVRGVGVKQHYAHKCMFSYLVADFESRKFILSNSFPTRYAKLSLPTMVEIMGRPSEIVKLDSLEIVIPSRDIDIFIHKLRGLSERRFANGKPYYKLKGIRNCLVLTIEQRVAMMEALESLSNRAYEREEEFWKKRSKK